MNQKRLCGCGCGRSLAGYHKNRKIHPECEKRVDEIRRIKKQDEDTRKRVHALVRKFIDFHQSNKYIYDNLLAMTMALINQGKMKYGIKALCEVVRWNINQQSDGDTFKINNNYPSLYARFIMIRNPILSGFFELRSGPLSFLYDEFLRHEIKEREEF